MASQSYVKISRAVQDKLVVGSIFLVIICTQASCAVVPDLEVKFEKFVPLKEHIKKADLIAVGILTSERHVRAIGSVSERYELREVRLKVEGILLGAFNEKQLSYYYYMPVGGWHGPAFNVSNPGERAIFYLAKDQGVWRAVTDGYLSHTTIYTGRYVASQTGTINLDDAIARLLLTPSEGIDDIHEYASHMRKSTAAAIDLTNEGVVMIILDELRSHPSAIVRDRCCLTIAEAFDETNCLDELIKRQPFSEFRKDAEELLRERGQEARDK